MRVKLPGMMGKFEKITIEIGNRNSILNLSKDKYLIVKHGRPEALVIRNPKNVPPEVKPRGRADIAVVFEDTVIYYEGEFEKIVDVYKIINGKVQAIPSS